MLFRSGSLSPRTLWTNAVLFLLIAYYLHHMYIAAAPAFHGSFFALARLAPFLFVLPAVWGVSRGMRQVQLGLGPALFLAAAITVLTAAAWYNNALWVLNWLLLCPAWFLVATAASSETNGGREAQQADRTSL